MTTAITPSAKPEIEYPDDDGEPMADNTLQFKWIVLIKDNLETVFYADPDVFVAGNLLWYPVEGEPTIRAAPDAMVAFGRPKGRRGSYKQWVEGNVAPQVVFETLSPGNRPGEMEWKFKFYEQYGVQEYYIYDPDDGKFEAWNRRGSRLAKVKDVFGFVSPLLKIRFEPGPGPDNLNIFDPDGNLFRTFSEVAEERNAAQHQAFVAQQQVSSAQQQASSAQQRAERLAAKLRALGVDPDSE